MKRIGAEECTGYFRAWQYNADKYASYEEAQAANEVHGCYSEYSGRTSAFDIIGIVRAASIASKVHIEVVFEEAEDEK